MIKLGNQEITLKVGSNDVSAAYLGSTLVYSGSTPPTPSYKWLATYTGGTTSSAECDSSSAITENDEIFQSSDLESVQIGQCVTSIGDEVFMSCNSLTSATIPDSVTSIGNGAFSNCSSLTSVNIPSGVTSIGNSAFEYCISLTSITIPSGVTSICDMAFNGCSSLTSVTIPNSVTSIGEFAFDACESFTTVTIPSGVTSMSDGAFSDCTSLTSVTVEATTPPTLNGYPFESTNDCPIFVPCESVNAYKTASVWSDYANRIQGIPPCIEPSKWTATYSDSHTESAQCDSSSAITNGEITLTDLESVQIGDCVTSISNNAFSNCSGLTSVTISSGVTTIGDGVFFNCKSLTDVIIPESVSNIGMSVFNHCTSLASITCLATTPPKLNIWSFDDTDNCPIYVPAQSVSAYKSAARWSTYASRIQAIP